MTFTVFKSDDSSEYGSLWGIVDANGVELSYEEEVFRAGESTAIEIAARLNEGADISIFFGSDDRGDYYYGSPTHALLGDEWFYADCPGAW